MIAGKGGGGARNNVSAGANRDAGAKRDTNLALGALAAVGLSVVLVVSCGILLESSLRTPILGDLKYGARAAPPEIPVVVRRQAGEWHDWRFR